MSMRARSVQTAAILFVLSALLAGGCASPQPEAPGLGHAAAQRADAAADFESRQRERAALLLRQGRLAEAAVAFEILGVLRPDLPEYREQWQHTQRLIQAGVAERLQRAVEAQKRGEVEPAMLAYLSVLALQPDHAQAADALRSIERDRNRRTVLNRTARQASAVAPRAPAAAKPPAPDLAATADRNDLEHAAMLTIQGEFDDAIQLLERRLSSSRPDDVVRALLADAYFQKAEDLADRDKAGAIAALENTVRLYPAHPLAAARLRQLRGAKP